MRPSILNNIWFIW